MRCLRRVLHNRRRFIISFLKYFLILTKENFILFLIFISQVSTSHEQKQKKNHLSTIILFFSFPLFPPFYLWPGIVRMTYVLITLAWKKSGAQFLVVCDMCTVKGWRGWENRERRTAVSKWSASSIEMKWIAAEDFGQRVYLSLQKECSTWLPSGHFKLFIVQKYLWRFSFFYFWWTFFFFFAFESQADNLSGRSQVMNAFVHHFTTEVSLEFWMPSPLCHKPVTVFKFFASIVNSLLEFHQRAQKIIFIFF